MGEVGVRELKQHLSEYLERAARGETVTVTDRGKPKAVLGPIVGRAWIQEGIAEGWVTPPSGGRLQPVPRLRAKRPVLDVLGEDRNA